MSTILTSDAEQLQCNGNFEKSTLELETLAKDTFFTNTANTTSIKTFTNFANTVHQVYNLVLLCAQLKFAVHFFGIMLHNFGKSINRVWG